MIRYQFGIEGMGCQACVRKVDSALRAIDGVRVERVNVGSATVDLGGPAKFGQVVNALDALGYRAGSPTPCPTAAEAASVKAQDRKDV